MINGKYDDCGVEDFVGNNSIFKVGKENNYKRREDKSIIEIV